MDETRARSEELARHASGGFQGRNVRTGLVAGDQWGVEAGAACKDSMGVLSSSIGQDKGSSRRFWDLPFAHPADPVSEGHSLEGKETCWHRRTYTCPQHQLTPWPKSALRGARARGFRSGGAVSHDGDASKRTPRVFCFVRVSDVSRAFRGRRVDPPPAPAVGEFWVAMTGL